MDLALHHCRPTVVLDEPFPTRLRHLQMLCEALLPEVLDCIVVSISYEVLDTHILSVGLEPIHQPRTIALDLLRGRDCEEDDLGKSLGMKRPEYAASKDG